MAVTATTTATGPNMKKMRMVIRFILLQMEMLMDMMMNTMPDTTMGMMMGITWTKYKVTGEV